MPQRWAQRLMRNSRLRRSQVTLNWFSLKLFKHNS
jgi:hypothetical protein